MITIDAQRVKPFDRNVLAATFAFVLIADCSSRTLYFQRTMMKNKTRTKFSFLNKTLGVQIWTIINHASLDVRRNQIKHSAIRSGPIEQIPLTQDLKWDMKCDTIREGETRLDKKKAVNIIEHHLRSYKTYKIGIKNLQKSLDGILPAITTNYTLREGTNGSFDITSKVEMAVLDRLEGSKAIYLKEQIRELQTVVDSIDEALEALGEYDQKFIQLRYIDGHSPNHVAEQINTGEDNIFKIRHRIMDNLLISLRNIITVSIQLL